MWYAEEKTVSCLHIYTEFKRRISIFAIIVENEEISLNIIIFIDIIKSIYVKFLC